MKSLAELRIKIFGDGADKASILDLYTKPYIKGFTTNPTLMRKAGISDYAAFAQDILKEVKDKPISFEVFSDDFADMERQAKIIASWAPNTYVKIPITNTKRESAFDLVKKLSGEGVKINVTAVFSLDQVRHIKDAFAKDVPGIVSVFAGRIADTGVDPLPHMKEAKAILADLPEVELLWASPREFLNIFHAEEAGSDIITITADLLKKADKLGFNLEDFSQETVQMFFDDAQKAGYKL